MKPNSERYVPGLIPDNPAALIQFLQDELPRISAAMNRFPNGMGVEQVLAGVQVDDPGPLTRLFVGEAANYDLPGGGWDPITGEWTVAASGLYQLNLNTIIDAFAGGNKDYIVELTIWRNGVAAWYARDSGPDDFDLGAGLSISGRLVREDIIYATVQIYDDNNTGTTTARSNMSITSTALE